jgi:signal transduction histidine kinase
MQNTVEKVELSIKSQPWAQNLFTGKGSCPELIDWIQREVLPAFLEEVTSHVDEVVDIDPDLSEPQILEKATRYMVDFLGARSASVRIYDPVTAQMLSYGSFPSDERQRETYIPLEGSIAGEVVKTRKAVLVPDILTDVRYQNKGVVYRKGVQSLMAIPLEITRFFPRERDTVGVIQIYFSERNRAFPPLEIQIANIMAKRLSFVIARKRLLAMHRLNEKREIIVRHIFRKLGKKGGIKMKEVFDRVIPELADIANVQSCALFSVMEDLNQVVLEAGYPEAAGYHSIGKSFPIESEPAFELVLDLERYAGDSIYEVVTPSYLLVADPGRSTLISNNLKRFASYHNINSILYVPLGVTGEITHFMTFDAIDQRKRYTEDEIQTFLFLGRELMKAQRMERLDDILHDFKNPAIATAGFARRLKRLLEDGDIEASKDQILRYVNILFDETTRLQELALSIYEVGKQHLTDLTDVLQRRFEINREAIKEQLRQNIALEEGPFDTDLKVLCHRMQLERVFDNLLNNATKAIPLKGGVLNIRTYAKDEWACAEITNTGQIPEEDRRRLLEGEGEGRGLYITYRIIRLLKGRIDVTSYQDKTTFVIFLPRAQ